METGKGRERGPPYSRLVPHTATATSGPIFRSYKASLLGETNLKGSSTLHESFSLCVEKVPNNPCLGERVMDPPSAGPFVFRSYSCVGKIVQEFASGMVKEGLLEANDESLRVLGIYMKNNSSWTIAEYACYSQSVTTVPLYDTLGPDTVEFIVNHTQMMTILCTPLELNVLMNLKCAGKCPSLRCVILTAYFSEPEQQHAAAAVVGDQSLLRVLTLSQVCRVGSAYPIRPRPPNPSTIATLCYTSGTTGQPKGAVITHENLVAVANAGLSSCFADMNSSDVYLSFLPLPHIFERIVLSALISCGASIGFSRGNPLLIIEDCIALRPTIFCAVPRLLNRIFDKVSQAAASATGLKGYMLSTALRDKLDGFRQRGVLTHFIWDSLVFSKLKAGLGLDRVRRLVSGGAPLPSATMEFFRILVGARCTVHEGYGMTETTGGISITYEEDVTVTGHVGGPLPVCEVKLVDVGDMGYLHSDSVHNQTRRCDGRGEICVRGPGVFQGYYKDPAATAAVLDSDGWLHTGDIGLWTPFGQLAIIDRKKNLLKLSQGEYVAVERVENVITSSCPLVAQAFVHGVSTENYIVAVVVPDEEAVTASGINTDSSLLKERILADIQRASREAGLHGFETVRSIWVEPANSASLWTPENGLMTPTFKIKRQAIATRFATQLASMYSPPRSKL